MNPIHEADAMPVANASANLAAVAEGGSGSTTSMTTATVGAAGTGTKSLVRKIVAIDLDKLRQTGLDRKIAEALGRRQKLATAAAAAGRLPTLPMSTSTSTTAVSRAPSTRPTNVPKKMVPPKITITRPLESPPVPTTPTPKNLQQTDEESKYSVQLTSANERLAHAKSVLKQNLMMKARARNAKAQTTATNTEATGIKLTENSATSSNPNASSSSASFSPSSGTNPNSKEALSLKKPRATFVDRPKKIVQQSLKPPPAIVRKPSPIKTPQEIARVLDFSSGSSTDTVQNTVPKGPPVVLNYTLPKPFNQIPYSSTTSAQSTSTIPKHSNQKSHTSASFSSPAASFQDSFKKQIRASAEKEEQKHAKALVNFAKTRPINYQHLPETKMNTSANHEIAAGHSDAAHDNDIPKASIKASAKRSKIFKEYTNKSAALSSVADNNASHTTGTALNNNSKISSSSANSKCELPIGFPEVSPLKQPFPSISLPGESPLPTISTFKKPFATAMQPPVTVKLESNEYFVQPNYFAMPAYQMETTTAEPFNFVKPNPTLTTSSAKSLIVLEHKVLSHDEKIDLTALRLAHTTTPQSTASSSMHTSPLHSVSATDTSSSGTGAGEIVIKEEKEFEEILPEQSLEKITPNVITIKSFKQPRKVIQAADKLKLPPEKIAALARQIQTQAKLKKQSGTILRIPTKDSVMKKIAKIRQLESTKQSKTFTSVGSEVSNNQQTIASETIMKEELVRSVKVEHFENTSSEKCTNPITISTKAYNHTTMTAGQQFKLIKAMDTETTSSGLNNEFLIETKPNLSNLQNTSSEIFTKTDPTHIITKRETDEVSSPGSDYNYQSHQFTYPSTSVKSSVEIIKEPLNYNTSSISAVDFIASLTSSHPITAETTLELSPEELNLNASFAMNLSPIRIAHYNRKESKLTKKIHNAELPSSDEHFRHEETAATEDMFMSNGDNNAEEFGVEIGNIVTIENDNNVSQLSPNAEGIFTIPSIDGIKKERDIIIASIANETLREVEDFKLPETVNVHKSKDFNKNIHQERTEIKVENSATIPTAQENAAISSKESSGKIVNTHLKTNVFEKSDIEPVVFNAEDTPQCLSNEVLIVNANECISESISTINVSPKIQNQQSNKSEIKEQSAINLITDINKEAIIEPNKLSNENSTEVKNLTNASNSESVDFIEATKIVEIKDAKTNETEEIITTNIIPAHESQKPSELFIVAADTEEKESGETNSNKISLKATEEVISSETSNSNDTTTAPSQTVAIAKKRISRFKKGTINLVQRKKSSVSNTQSKTEVNNDIAKIQSNTEKPNVVATKDDFCNGDSNISPNKIPSEINPEVEKLEEISKIPISESTENIQSNNEEHASVNATADLNKKNSDIEPIKLNVKSDKNEEESSIEPIKLSIDNCLDVNKSTKTTESVEMQDTIQISTIDEPLADTTVKKDISQLVNPPPMPKKKRALKEDITTHKIVDEAETSSHSNSVSLLEVIQMSENPESLLPAQVPFKPKSLEQETREVKVEQPIGIKSLLMQLESGKLTDSNVANKTQSNIGEESEADALSADSDGIKIRMCNIPEANVISADDKSLQFDTVKLTVPINNEETENSTKNKSDTNEQTNLETPSKRVGKVVDQQENADRTNAQPEQETQCTIGDSLILCNKSTSIQCDSNSDFVNIEVEAMNEDEQATRNAVTEENEQAIRNVVTEENEQEKAKNVREEKQVAIRNVETEEKEQETAKNVREEEQEATKDLIPSNEESENSSKLLNTPPKALCCKENLEFLPVTPPVKTPSDLCAETKKLKYPSQSSEDAEIDSTQSYHDFDEDEEIAATAEESSQENLTLRTIQRKRLRKTALGNIKKQKRPFDTDSEDDREDENGLNDVDIKCQSTQVFRGFDETSPTNSKMQKSLDFIIAATSAEDDSADDADMMRGRKRICKPEIVTSSGIATGVADGDTTTMKNWLTTGKAIAPTAFYSGRKVRQRVSMHRTSERIGSGTNMPLKKRWELAQSLKYSQYEDTDITDDTSPADDDNDEKDAVDANDEEDKFQKLLRANSVITGKRSLRMLEHEEAEIIASKKLKLPEVLKKNIANYQQDKCESDADNEEALFLKPMPLTPPQEEVVISEDVSAPGFVTKKRFGRKLKIIEDLEPLETSNQLEVNTSIDSTATRSVDEESFTTNNSTPTNRIKVKKVTEINREQMPAMTTSTPNIPKKRGRKPKVESAQETSTSMILETTVNPADKIASENTPTVPKKRGRKPKAKNLIVEESNISTKPEPTSNIGVPEIISKIETLETTAAEATPALTDETKNMPAVPKKRGRKPKAKPTSIDESVPPIAAPEHKSIIEYFETTITTPESKTAEVATLPDNNLESIEAKTTPILPKKRGRKPKISFDVAATPTNLTADQTVEDLLAETPDTKLSLDELQTSASIPKKRGRKSQTVKTAETTQELTESMLNDDTPLLAAKKRGRKPKTKVEEDVNETICETTTTEAAIKQKSIIEYFEAHDGPKSTTTTISEASIATDSSMSKKRGRKPRSLTLPATESSEVQPDDSIAVDNNSAADSNSEPQNFNARLLLIRKREEMESDAVLTATAATAGTGPLQCGLCLVRTTRAKWTQHLAEHYGVGWIVGEPELNLRQRSFVLTTMINFYKETQIKGLACRMCARMYRSGLGLLSHVETCGIPRVMALCEYCNREYQSPWLVTHQRTCAARKDADEDAGASTTKVESKAAAVVPNVLNNVGRVKRASLMKAESKLKAIGEEMVSAAAAESQQFEPKNLIKYHSPLAIDEIRNEWTNSLKNFGKAFCPQKACRFYLEAAFNADILTALEGHLGTCKHVPKPGYQCVKCRQKTFKHEAEAIKHVMQTHKPQTGSDFEAEGSDSDVKMEDGSGSDNDDDDDESSGVDEEEDGVSNDDTATSTSTPGSKRRRQPATSGSAKKSRSKKVKLQRAPFQSVFKTLYPRRSDDCARLAAKKWKEFCATNYAKSLLYTYATPTFTTSTINLNTDHSESNDDIVALEACLPSQRVSMKYAFEAKPKFQKQLGAPDTTIQWSELKRFETAKMQADQLVFLGAPVKTLAWAPLPSHVSEQYLAVAYRKDIDKYTRLQNSKIAPTLILIYKLSTQKEDATQLQMPQLSYAIRIPDGPVQCFAFLPSGGYDEATNRLGLLAVGTTAGATINIYALPLSVQQTPPQQNENNFCDKKLYVLDLKPALLLTLDMELLASAAPVHSLTTTQCLQICWSETLSHSHIIASFSNGCVGIWDISTKENLNCFVVEDMHHFVPLNLFYVGEKIIRALAIHYDSTGPRWLAAACHSRKFVVFDIRDLTQPVPVKEENSKNIIRSMDWSALWETPVIGFCDIVPKDGRAVTAISLTGVFFNRNKIDNMLSAVSQIHYNPAINVHVCATDNGDIIFLNTRELHRDDVFPKSQKNSRAVSMMDIKCLNGEELPQCKGSGSSVKPAMFNGEEIVEEEDEAVENRTDAEEQDYKQRFGLVFGDVIKYKVENKSTYLSAQRIPPTNVVSYMRVNSLRCNLNATARRLVAVGYENGFLRIMRFNPNKFSKDT